MESFILKISSVQIILWKGKKLFLCTYSLDIQQNFDQLWKLIRKKGTKCTSKSVIKNSSTRRMWIIDAPCLLPLLIRFIPAIWVERLPTCFEPLKKRYTWLLPPKCTHTVLIPLIREDKLKPKIDSRYPINT